MSQDIKQRLIQKIQSDELSHFNLITPTLACDADDLISWVNELVLKAMNIKGAIQNSPDIFVLTGDEDKKQFSIDDIAQIHKFTSYKAAVLNKKVLIIKDLSKLTETHCNKLLKIFEEPPIDIIIFLLNPKKIKVLETINSRAIKIRVPIEQNNHCTSLLELYQNCAGYSQFHEEFTKVSVELSEITTQLLENGNMSITDQNKITQLRTKIDQLKDDYIYNSSMQNKTFKIYSIFKFINN